MKNKIMCVVGIILIIFISSLRFNISPSAPEGIYLVNYISRTFNKGDYVIYKIPKEYKEYIPEKFQSLDTIKKIKATKGDVVYIRENEIFINDKKYTIIKYDIPVKLNENKYILEDNEYLTLSNNEDSLDGRYYGVINKSKIKYKAYLIYEYKK